MTTEETKTPSRPEIWSTLAEYDREEEYLAQLGEEFHPGAKPIKYFDSEGKEDSAFLSPVKRRTFLKLSGFATLAAMLQGCERPVQKVIPYVNKPEEITHGIPNYYASTWTESGESYGIIVKTLDGRPIKIEGNPADPVNSGSLSASHHATMTDLYNPDRLRFPVRINRSFNGEVGDPLDDELQKHPTIDVVDQEVGGALASAVGKVVFLTRSINGPANEALLNEFKAEGDNFEVVYYDDLQDGLERDAIKDFFGEAVSPRYLFDRADVVLCLGGDPLGQGDSSVEYMRGFAAKRDPKHPDGMSRVYSFEPVPTLTGASADYRYQTRPDHLVRIGLGIAHLLLYGGADTKLDGASSIASDSKVRARFYDWSPAKVSQETGLSEDELKRVAKSLKQAPGKSIVYTKSAESRMANVDSLVHLGVFLNYILDNFKHTIDISESPSLQSRGTLGGLTKLIKDMKAGKVELLILNEVNPVYTLPASSGFAEAMGKVSRIVSLGRMMDETSALSDLIVPGVHTLETWGDASSQAGLYGIQQPAVRTLFGEVAANTRYFTRSWQESLMAFVTASGSSRFKSAPSDEEVEAMMAAAGVESRNDLDPAQLEPKQITWYDFLVSVWEKDVYPSSGSKAGNFKAFWGELLQNGFVDTRKNAYGKEFSVPSIDTDAVSSTISHEDIQSGTILVAYRSNVHGDGRSMGNPFLLELSDPISKVCWENYAAISPKHAEKLGVKTGDFVEVSANGSSIEIPVYIQPGVHEDVIGVMLGWGRNTFGGVGSDIGVNVTQLLSMEGDKVVVSSSISATIKKTSGKTKLADIQGHNYLHSPAHMGIMVNKQKGDVPAGAQMNKKDKPVYDRPIFGETTLNEWKKDHYAGYPNHAEHGENPESLWANQHTYEGHHWGMSIDLNACNGCNACVIACQVENNIPVVGKDEVLVGREMHWIRLDRYYRGDKNDPDFAIMPVMCQHCDNAPCETVCPVIATMHNNEGLNVMTYNRCVGTRYCANNCPYKVRRFNFWQYTDYRTGPTEGRKRVSPLELVLNPDVTTRTRGVMEKCTFCVQRIRVAKDTARMNGTKVGDEDLQTACQQTCPAKAITFGDRNNAKSEVAQAFEDPRAYGLLTDLNTDPSVRYKTLVRNRDEPSPYRTKYQAHRMHKSSHGGHHDDAGHGDEKAGSHDDHNSH